MTVVLEVIDGDTGLPVSNAVVRMPALGTNLLTDSAGVARLVDIGVGSHRLILTRMGYEAQRGSFTVDRGGSFRIAMSPVLVPSDAAPGNVAGQVIDPESREGIADVEVLLGGALRVVTDAEGWFDIEEVAAGRHMLEARFLGRQTLRDSIFVRDGQTLRVEVPLPIEAIALEGITVSSQPKFLTDVGFFRRKRAGTMYRGRQWTAEELADRDPAFLRDVISEVPAVMRRIPREGEGAVIRFQAFGCPLTVYVDNFRMEPWFDLDHIDPRRVAALEVYHGRTMPLRYNHCGVILVWMKRP